MAFAVTYKEMLRVIEQRKKDLAKLEAAVMVMPRDGKICPTCGQTFTKRSMQGRINTMQCYCDYEEEPYDG